jgi:hypothetical protein
MNGERQRQVADAAVDNGDIHCKADNGGASRISQAMFIDRVTPRPRRLEREQQTAVKQKIRRA